VIISGFASVLNLLVARTGENGSSGSDNEKRLYSHNTASTPTARWISLRTDGDERRGRGQQLVAKWMLAETDSAQAEQLLAEVKSRGDRLLVLELALAEICNVIWKRYLRGLATLEEARGCLDDLLRCPVQVEPSPRLLNQGL
jgi:hypothetical protein